MAKRIGFIGYGLRSRTMMQAFRALEADVRVVAIVDPRAEEIRQEIAADPYFERVSFYDTAASMLASASLDGVFIGTRCSLHTPLAIQVLSSGLPLLLEKPVCISPEQYERLAAAAKGRESRVLVSFPLRLTAVAQAMKRVVDAGTLGRITMVQAINNVPYGSVYYHSWYRDANETGGLFLQKMTHDIDYIHYLIGEVPVDAFARTAKLYFRGDRPAGLHCPACPEYHPCRESSYAVGKILKEEVQGDACCFARDTGNEDMASAIFTCPSGAIITYSQNFIVKKGAARRGCRLIGTDGSAEFDFYTGVIREDRYLTAETVTHTLAGGGAHFGGDERLALAFLRLMDGEAPESDLTAGLNSAAVCLAARASAESGTIQPVQR